MPDDTETPRQSRLPQKERKEQIVGIAARLFAQKGFDGTSLRDVAEVSGLTKAALYYHFPHKLELFEEVVRIRMTQLITVTEAAVLAERDPVQRIRAFMLACAREIDTNSTDWQVASSAFWSIEDPGARERAIVLRDRFEGLLKRLIAEAVATRALRNVDVGLLTRLLLSGLNMLPRWYKSSKPLTAVQIIEVYLDLILDGARPR